MGSVMGNVMTRQNFHDKANVFILLKLVVSLFLELSLKYSRDSDNYPNVMNASV